MTPIGVNQKLHSSFMFVKKANYKESGTPFGVQCEAD